MTAPALDRLISASAAARELGVSVTTVLSRAESGVLNVYEVGRRRVFDRDEVMAKADAITNRPANWRKGTGAVAEIVAALASRYPCQALPPGAQAALASEFGVSRERIRQIASAAGYAGPRSTAGMRKRPAVLCGSCGNVTAAKNGICLKCRWVEVPCSHCGSTVRRLASNIAIQFSDRRQQYRVERGLPLARGSGIFCNRSCMGKYVAAHYGWGSGRGKNQPRKAVAK